MSAVRWITLLLAAALFAMPMAAQTGDTDGDGIPDSVDLCPREPGPRENRGCPLPATPIPDTDGDGLPDNADSCPTQPGPRDNAGCPVSAPPSDRDGDGTPDNADACPDQGGPRDNAGCPVSAPPQPTRPPYRPAPPPDTQNCYATPASENNVNVREQPTTQGRILRGLAPNTHLLVLDATINPQGQTWFQVQLPEGLAFVADSAVVVQGNCSNLPVVTLVPQGGGGMPIGLCFIDPAKVAGNISAGVLDDFTTVPNPEQANPETGNLFLNAAVVTVRQPATATFIANEAPAFASAAHNAPAATLMRVTVYTSSFQQVAYQEVPIGQPVSVNLPDGDYYWQFQFDKAGVSLSIKCQMQEVTVQTTMPICVMARATDATGDLIAPFRVDNFPLVDGQDQPNEAGAFVLEYPFIAYEDILLRVLTMGSSPLKAMVFIPSVQLYQSDTTIPVGGFADIAIPQGVYTLEFVSATPFDVQALCWPGNTPPEVMGTPEPPAEGGDAIGFIIGDCVAATGFEPNGMPQNPHTFSPMDPLKLEYWEPNDEGKYRNKIQYLIANVPVQLFFSLLSEYTTMDLYIYDIANGAGAVVNVPYISPSNHSVYLPEGVFFVSFTSGAPGQAVVNCLPGEPPSTSSPFDIPEFNGSLTDLFGVPVFGFEPFAPTPSDAADGSAALLTPPDPSLPLILVTRLGDGSVRVEQPVGGDFELVFGDDDVEPSPERPTLVLNTGLLLGDGSVLPTDLFACDGNLREGDLRACDGSVRPQIPIAGDGSVLPIIGVVLGFEAHGGTLDEPIDLGAIVLQTPDPAFNIGDLAGGVSFGAPSAENFALQPEACEVIPSSGSSGCPINPQTGTPSPSCLASQAANQAASNASTIQAGFNSFAPDFDASSDQTSFVILTKPMQVNRPARVTAELVQNIVGGPVTFDLSGIAVSVQAFRADGGWFTQVNVGQAAASVDIPTGPYTHFRGAVVRLGPPVDGSGDLKLTCTAR
ncbi:MAG: thrombospondin type 3 repeat-containing protein [Anaerolineae bacterium]